MHGSWEHMWSARPPLSHHICALHALDHVTNRTMGVPRSLRPCLLTACMLQQHARMHACTTPVWFLPFLTHRHLLRENA